ncbi:PREDICTED: EMBRYO SURROUNDING FACTOR 1-like protein 10 [Camelina sativa]|uniref:EMBRYO SURROUNDING FACTOR 1-like protein 10 n=1 Tax=Camelina sativa TaxID=90675 RepID=A0ABM1R9Z7_CAMSA|nr:PREDICTED: EMBRYO SURROUNDING FACTOR 1-like protein 10 [Camelina sativa]XP_019095835.1 PREDICTED: EMBRYO SURROUNDING FACTOR 1-like protein 10 [Camelina sativa]
MSSSHFAIFCLFMISLVPLLEFGNAQGSEASLQRLDPSMCIRVLCAKNKNQKWCFCCAGQPKTCHLNKRGCAAVCKRVPPR